MTAKRKPGRPRLTLARQLFAEGWATGLSYTALAKAIGITRRSAVRWRAEMGLPQRPGPDGKIHTGKRAA